MPGTAVRPVFWTLGGLVLGSRGINGTQWMGLAYGRQIAGEDIGVPYSDSLHHFEREHRGHRGGIQIQVNGGWTIDNNPVAGGQDGKHVQLYRHLRDLWAVTGVKTIQDLTLTITGVGSETVPAVVDNPGSAVLEHPWIASLTLDLSLPEGPVDLAALFTP